MAKRVGAKYLMLTHLAPSLGAVIHNRWKVPGGPLTEADYRKAVEAGGFTGNTIVGTDLATLRLSAKWQARLAFVEGLALQRPQSEAQCPRWVTTGPRCAGMERLLVSLGAAP